MDFKPLRFTCWDTVSIFEDDKTSALQGPCCVQMVRSVPETMTKKKEKEKQFFFSLAALRDWAARVK